MDLSPPDRDGRVVSEELKNDPETHSISIIAITAHATKKKRDQALDGGCEAYEPKPAIYVGRFKQESNRR